MHHQRSGRMLSIGQGNSGVRNGLLQKEIAEKIGVDESRVSDILRGRLEDFTLDRLIGYTQKLHPTLRVQIDAA